MDWAIGNTIVVNRSSPMHQCGFLDHLHNTYYITYRGVPAPNRCVGLQPADTKESVASERAARNIDNTHLAREQEQHYREEFSLAGKEAW